MTDRTQLQDWRNRANKLHAQFVRGRWPVNSDEDRRFLALALCGEAGEFANLIKKRWRGDTIPIEQLWSELADIRIYLHLLMVAFDCDGDVPLNAKLDEVYSRKGWPVE